MFNPWMFNPWVFNPSACMLGDGSALLFYQFGCSTSSGVLSAWVSYQLGCPTSLGTPRCSKSGTRYDYRCYCVPSSATSSSSSRLCCEHIDLRKEYHVIELAELRGDQWSTSLTVVVPTYNEADNLPPLVDALLALPLKALRVLVVDDDSPDGTGKLADELAEKHERVSVLHRTMKDGLGRAYVEGFAAALNGHGDSIRAGHDEPEWIVQMDADGSHPVDAIPRLLSTALRTGSDLVIGSRYVVGGSIDSTWGFNRKSLSMFGNWYANLILDLNIHDATAGFKLWNAHKLRCLDLARVRSNGYAFQVEMNFLARQRGCRIVEIPIHFADRAVGQSKMNFHIKVESALRPWRLRWQYRGQHREVIGNQPDVHESRVGRAGSPREECR